jgi:hypothetical protein
MSLTRLKRARAGRAAGDLLISRPLLQLLPLAGLSPSSRTLRHLRLLRQLGKSLSKRPVQT